MEVTNKDQESPFLVITSKDVRRFIKGLIIGIIGGMGAGIFFLILFPFISQG